MAVQRQLHSFAVGDVSGVCVVGSFLSGSNRQRGGNIQETDSSQMAAVTRGGAGWMCKGHEGLTGLYLLAYYLAMVGF